MNEEQNEMINNSEENKDRIEEKKHTFQSERLVNVVRLLQDNEETGRQILPVFIGGDEEIHKNIMQASIAYLSYKGAEEKNLKKEAEIFYNKFIEIKDKFFSDLTIEEMGNYATVYMQFVKRYLDTPISKMDDIVDNSEFYNRYKLTIGDQPPKLTPYINPLKPNVRKSNSQSDRMRRRYFAATGNTPDTITVLLYNSYILTKIRRPTRIELIKLINDIELKLRYFGERWSVNSLNLERAGIAREIVDFFLDRVVHHSVDGILSNDELKNYILANDINTITLAILQASSPKGVYYNINCLANKCGHSELVHVDPYDMYLVNEEDMEEDQRDFIYTLLNKGGKYDPSDILKYQNRYSYKGKKVDNAVKIYEDILTKTDDTPAVGQFTIKVPNLTQYFTSFDLVAEEYDPTIKKYALDYPNIQEFRKKRSEFMGAIRMGEYLHWIDNYITFGNPNIENDEDIVEDRSESQREFEKGLLTIFSEDDVLYWEVLKKILECVPYMSHTFIGIPNSSCPSCHGKPEDNPDKNQEFTIQTGFTPIDMVTNFFDHTHILIDEIGRLHEIQEDLIS